MDERRFDDWTRDLAADGPTRRRLLAGMAGLAFAGLGALWRSGEAAAQGTDEPAADDTDEATANCNGNFCSGNTQQCKGNCVCYKRVGGDSVCARPQGQCPQGGCRTDRDCKSGHACVQSGRKCCDGQKTACAKKC